MSEVVDRQLQHPRKVWVCLCPLTHAKKLVLLEGGVRILPKSSQVLAGDGIDDCLILLSTDVTVFVQDGVIYLAFVDTDQAIV